MHLFNSRSTYLTIHWIKYTSLSIGVARTIWIKWRLLVEVCARLTLILDHRQPDGLLSLSLYFRAECLKWISCDCMLLLCSVLIRLCMYYLTPSDLHIFRYGLQEEVTFCEVIVSWKIHGWRRNRKQQFSFLIFFHLVFPSVLSFPFFLLFFQFKIIVICHLSVPGFFCFFYSVLVYIRHKQGWINSAVIHR